MHPKGRPTVFFSKIRAFPVVPLAHGKTRAESGTGPKPELSVFQTELLVEAADATASIHHLLLTGEEGVTLRANFYADIALSRSCLDNVTASTPDRSLLVLGMDAFLHECSPLSA